MKELTYKDYIELSDMKKYCEKEFNALEPFLAYATHYSPVIIETFIGEDGDPKFGFIKKDIIDSCVQFDCEVQDSLRDDL